jgi:hypothetical protein
MFEYRDPNNQGQGWYSNPTVHDTVMLPEYKMGLMNIPLERMLILLNKSEEDNLSTYATEYRTYSCFDPSSFNYLFALYDDQTKGKLASQIWENWTVGGVGVTDNDQKMKVFRGVNRGRPVVMAKQGFLKVVNYWGNEVRKGSRLYLIFKRKKIPYNTSFELGRDSASFRQLDQTMKPANEKDFRPFQIVPWSGFNPPPSSETEYEDYDGEIQDGVWIQVGKSDDDLTLSYITINEETPRVMHSVRHLIRREAVQILLDIGAPHCVDNRMPY